VRYVLEGSEQRSGSLVRVSAQLIDVGTGAHLWAERFDADCIDLLQTQDEIVTRLARALQIELTALESAWTSLSTNEARSAEDLALAGEAIYLRYGPSRRESEAGFQLCERGARSEQRSCSRNLGGTDHDAGHRHAEHRSRCRCPAQR
jgi:hypothetical protein